MNVLCYAQHMSNKGNIMQYQPPITDCRECPRYDTCRAICPEVEKWLRAVLQDDTIPADTNADFPIVEWRI